MDKASNGGLKNRRNSKGFSRYSNGLGNSKSFLRVYRSNQKYTRKGSSRLAVVENSTRKPRPKRNSNVVPSSDVDLSNTRYLWKQRTSTEINDLTVSQDIQDNLLHSSCETQTAVNLGHKISSENSLHAVHKQHTGDDDLIEEETAEEIRSEDECIEDVDLKSSGQNTALLEQLLDSKSNRMLQSINPSLEVLPKPGSFINSVSQIEKLSRPKTPNGVLPHGAGDGKPDGKSSKKSSYDHRQEVTVPNGGVRRGFRLSNESHGDLYSTDRECTSPRERPTFGGARRASRTIFSGKMEILEEKTTPNEKNDTSANKRNPNNSPVTSSSSCDVSSEGRKQQSNLHAAVSEESVKPTSPVREESGSTVEQEISSKVQKNEQATSKFLTAVCRNHNRRKSGENMDAVLFCKICIQAVCYKCAFERHKDHDVLPLASAVSLIRSKMAERKRGIENDISQMRGRRKLMESSSEDIRKRIKTQFENAIDRLQEKEDEIMSALDKARQERIGSLYKMQAHNETCWGQIDAVLKTADDVKMLEEFSSLSPETINMTGVGSPATQPSCLSPVIMNPRVSVDLQKVQEAIENIRLRNEEDCNSSVMSNGDINDTARKKKKLAFKLDPTTAGSALRISPSCAAAEYVGSARNSVHAGHPLQIHPAAHSSTLHHPHPYPGVSAMRLRRSNFATVLADTSITQGKQYWEVSVNRSMEYRLGVAYKHMQGTKTLADDHNSWTLCLTYPDRFSAMNKGKKEYIFVASHVVNSTTKVMRIGIYLDYERGILSFYNASNSSEKRHLYTFRTFFNRPVWPLIALRQGKLQIITSLPIPKNLVWKTR